MAVLSFVLLLSVAPSDDVTVELVTEDVEAAAVTDVEAAAAAAASSAPVSYDACRRTTAQALWVQQQSSSSGGSASGDERVRLVDRGVCYDLTEDVDRVWRQCSYARPRPEDLSPSAGCSSRAEKRPCGGVGVCFFGVCHCKPGHDGERCESPGWVPPKPELCDSRGPQQRKYMDYADACLINPSFGAAIIPASRWQSAQRAEGELWRSMAMTTSAPGHGPGLAFFDHFKALGAHNSSLGRIAEIGAGPWTWTLDMLNARPDLHASGVTLIDPGIPGYLASGQATFRDGLLRGVPVEQLPIGAEEVPSCYTHRFDVVVQINVLEHTFNAFAALDTMFRLLKPGGLLVFSERVVKLSAHSQIFHPVRLTKGFYDRFLGRHLDEIYRLPYKTALYASKHYVEAEIYYIGRKKSGPGTWVSFDDVGGHLPRLVPAAHRDHQQGPQDHRQVRLPGGRDRGLLRGVHARGAAGARGNS